MNVEVRLRQIEQQLYATRLDAQFRDWTAERPDRVSFARLAQARGLVYSAARAYGPAVPSDDEAGWWLSNAIVVAFPIAVLLVIGHPADPLRLAAALVGGTIVAQAVLSARAWARLRRAGRQPAERAPIEPAPIDDPYRHAELTRRIEECAAAARADQTSRRSVAATELDSALVWLSRVQEGLRPR